MGIIKNQLILQINYQKTSYVCISFKKIILIKTPRGVAY